MVIKTLIQFLYNGIFPEIVEVRLKIVDLPDPEGPRKATLSLEE